MQFPVSHPPHASAARFSKRIAGFGRDRSGAVAPIYGLTMVLMFTFIGGSVDFGRWLHARRDTLNAVDSAVLAGARMLQINGQDVDGAMLTAKRMYEDNTKSRLPLKHDSINFVTNEFKTEVTATGHATIDTLLLGLAGIDQLELVKLSGAEFGVASIAESISKGNASEIEVSMMLDVTGSMEGQKLTDMKLAAKDLVDILLLDGQNNGATRIALAPFSAAVRAGDIIPQAAKNAAITKTLRFRDGNTRTWNLAPECVSERLGDEKFTDAAPNGQNKVERVFTSDGSCKPNNAVVPLSTDKAMLKATIDGFEATGGTAGHLGTAWAWYLLSPNWAQAVGPNSRPKSYSLLSEQNSNGSPKLQKIAILMTDGEYNIQYCNNVVDKDTGYGSANKSDCSSPNGRSTQQARELCANMKAAGITVYSIGFQLPADGEAVETLRDHCASGELKFYPVQSGEELRQAFRDIALKVRPLALIK